MKIVLLLLMILAGGCATSTRQTDKLVRNRGDLTVRSKIGDVPFIKQKEYHCGPATMAMVLKHAGKEVSINDLNQSMMTSQLKGTFQSEMLSAARRNGMMTIPINDMTSLLKEVSHGHPVIVFQNLTFPWVPMWHYSVVIGHNLRGPDMILHSGNDKFKRMDMRLFERSWNLGGLWGLLVIKPHELSETASENTHLESAALLENIGKLDEAKTAYETILTKWNKSLGALIGLGNINYTNKKLKLSKSFLEKAITHHPKSSMAWHNLAIVEAELGLITKARSSSQKALELTDAKNRLKYEESLSPILSNSQQN